MPLIILLAIIITMSYVIIVIILNVLESLPTYLPTCTCWDFPRIKASLLNDRAHTLIYFLKGFLYCISGMILLYA